MDQVRKMMFTLFILAETYKRKSLNQHCHRINQHSTESDTKIYRVHISPAK